MMNKGPLIRLAETASTNSWLMQAVERGEALDDLTVVCADRQTAGRGQVGHGWESEPGRNLTFSMLLRPVWLHPARQFVLSEAVALAVADTLDAALAPYAASAPASMPHDTMRGAAPPDTTPSAPLPQAAVKWPNDVYIGDRKACGILIESRIVGARLAETVVGIGINVNQTEWRSGAPNPVSLRQLLVEAGTDATFDLDALLRDVTRRIAEAYGSLSDPEAAAAAHRRYASRLYRREGLHPYVDVATGTPFEARIADVEPDGPLVLEEADGRRRRYLFKEVHFVLPCGVTKE